MKKVDVNQFKVGSPEYVIAHAKWKKSRGKKASAVCGDERNPKKALKLAKNVVSDQDFNDYVIKEVSKDTGFFTMENGLSAGCENITDVEPGHIARFYGECGFSFRGLLINGVVRFYKTKVQQDAEHKAWVKKKNREDKAKFEENKVAMDKAYDKLPEIFRKRIDRFRSNNPDFRWQFENYEVFCCQQAVIIAKAVRKLFLKYTKTDQTLTTETIDYDKYFRMFDNLSEYKKTRIAYGYARNEHSGNTFSCSMILARLYLSEYPENVIRAHGALSPLVGSLKYGDITEEEPNQYVIVIC